MGETKSMNQNMMMESAWLTLASGKPPVIGGSDAVGAPVEGAADGAVEGGATPPAGGGSFDILLFGMLLFFVFLIVSTMMQGKKEKRRKQELLNSLARHDRVQTLGGIIGTIVEISDGEVVLRVDEATNTRIRVARSAVQTVLKKGRGSSSASQAEPKPETAETTV